MHDKPHHIGIFRDARTYGFHCAEIKTAVNLYPLLRQQNRFDFYTLVYFESNEGYVTVDGEQINASPERLVPAPPFSGLEISVNIESKGLVFFFCKDFYSSEFNGMNLLYLFSFFSKYKNTSRVPYLSLHDENKLANVFSLIMAEYSGLQVNETIIRSYLNVVLFKMINMVSPGVQASPDNSPALLDKLSALIETHYRTQRNIRFYAQETGISESRLNQLCEQFFQSGLKQLINERVIIEARLMLKQTSLTVAEIAYSLNFTDDSNFNKLFKAHTRLTPKKYRDIHNKLGL